MSIFGEMYDSVADFFVKKSKTIYIYLLFFIEINQVNQTINGNNQNNPADKPTTQEEVTYLITSLNNNLVSRMCNKMWAFLRV